MQLFFVSDEVAIVLFFVVWFVIQMGSALIALAVPDHWFHYDAGWFKTWGWEKGGAVYQAIFKVHRWKGLLPDGSAIIKKGYRKKHLTDFSPANLNKFLIESCRSELTHLLAIVPFWVFGLFYKPVILIPMLCYALVVNLPCIIAQRYNRPRISALLKKQLLLQNKTRN